MAKIEIGGREYDLVLSVHAMEAIEEEYGDLKEALGKFNRGGRNMKMVRSMFRILANAGQHRKGLPENVTGDEIGDLNLAGLDQLSNALNQAITESLKAETVDGGPADDEEADVYAEEMERQQKNG